MAVAGNSCRLLFHEREEKESVLFIYAILFWNPVWRRSPGHKAKLETPFRPCVPIHGAQEPTKWPILTAKNIVFQQNFFSLKPHRNVCYGFLVGFRPRNVKPFGFLSYLKDRASYGPSHFGAPWAISIFWIELAQKFQVPGIELGGFTTWPRGFQLAKPEPWENWPQSWRFWKCHVL